MPSAIVTGATGIIGRGIVTELSKDSETWEIIYAISRSQKEAYSDHVKHANIDLSGNPRDIAKQLDGVEAEYLFFAAYTQKETDEENWEANGFLLRNFLDALALSGGDRKLRRVLLVTGGKRYGVQFGAVKQPCEESDPWVEGPEYPPNFYYNQENILKEMSQDKSWDWVVTIPSGIIGVVKKNFMNFLSPIALYACLCRELEEDFIFPGNEICYLQFDSFTPSKLHAQFMAWAALEPMCSNEAFNIASGGGADSWQTLWPKIATWFGCVVPPDQFTRPAPLPSRIDLPFPPPLARYAKSSGLAGSTRAVKPGAVVQRVDLVQWARRPEVRQAWIRLAQREGLDESAFENATWGFAGLLLGRDFGMVMSTSKAKRLGWTGYCDTWDSFRETFDSLEKEKVIPKLRP